MASDHTETPPSDFQGAARLRPPACRIHPDGVACRCCTCDPPDYDYTDDDDDDDEEAPRFLPREVPVVRLLDLMEIGIAPVDLLVVRAIWMLFGYRRDFGAYVADVSSMMCCDWHEQRRGRTGGLMGKWVIGHVGWDLMEIAKDEGERGDHSGDVALACLALLAVRDPIRFDATRQWFHTVRLRAGYSEISQIIFDFACMNAADVRPAHVSALGYWLERAELAQNYREAGAPAPAADTVFPSVPAAFEEREDLRGLVSKVRRIEDREPAIRGGGAPEFVGAYLDHLAESACRTCNPPAPPAPVAPTPEPEQVPPIERQLVGEPRGRQALALLSALVAHHAHGPLPWSITSRVLDLEKRPGLRRRSNDLPSTPNASAALTDLQDWLEGSGIAVAGTPRRGKGLLLTGDLAMIRALRADSFHPRAAALVRESLAAAPTATPTEASATAG